MPTDSTTRACGCHLLDMLCSHSLSMRAFGREGATVGEILAAEGWPEGEPFSARDHARQVRALKILCGATETARLTALSEAEIEAELDSRCGG